MLFTRTHNRILDELKKQHESEKEELRVLYFTHIKTLESHIEDLKRLVFSPTSASDVPLVHLEADAVMNQRDEILEVPVSKEKKEEYDFILRERDRIFSGEFEDLEQRTE